MPSPWLEALEISRSAGIVAIAAGTLGLACRWIARRPPVVPPYRKAYMRWLGIDVAILAFICLVFRDAVTAALEPLGVFEFVIPAGPTDNVSRLQRQYQRSTLVGLAGLPLLALAFRVWKARAGAEHTPARFAADMATGAFAWFAIAPATFLVHFIVNAVLQALAIPPDEHPLKQMQLSRPLDIGFLFAGACVVAPCFEEMGYRRIIVPWAARKVERSWIVLFVAGFASLAFATGRSHWGPPILVMTVAVAMLALGLVARRRPRLPVRPASALLATAVLFGVIHSSVWPTPIPLFVLGLGLGWLVLRTRSATAAIVTHGLFNAISAIHLLRGGA